MDDAVDRVLSYHQRTKHHLHQYARSPGYLDWATQPDPFRTYHGAAIIDLPLLADSVSTSYGEIFHPEAVASRPIDLTSIATLFELALGLSAWKEFKTSRWALRCNPSSGNLHPTEGYLIVPEVSGVPAGVYHYVSRDHRLEQRCTPSQTGIDHLARALGSGFVLGLTSIHWREAWKYGERAFRYCQHDAGHAIATFRIAAAALGWSARLLDLPGDAEVAHLLGLDRAGDFTYVAPADREQPDALLYVNVQGLGEPDLAMLQTALADGTWAGQANPLSGRHVDWPIIEATAEAAWKPATAATVPADLLPLPELQSDNQVLAATLIRQRRSCLGLDGKNSIPAETFYRILDRLLPRPGVPPWDALPWRPLLHLGIFVHLVNGLQPGIYFLERDPSVHDRLRGLMREVFLWLKPPGCPEHLHLYCLAVGDFREAAQTVSCHQDIASDGAFSLGMVAQFGDVIRASGPWWYRRLFWESGVLGQVLYLEAEAAGLRGTGIGCYFDDLFHDLLGLQTDAFQDLYHFTIGGPVDDPRLTTLPPYGHLSTRMRR